jgi:thioredoxin reductase (NADPH)
MGLEIVVGIAAILLAIIGAGTVLLIVQARRTENKARVDHATTLQKGALPPSLHPLIDQVRCIGSGSCVESCPEKDVIGMIDGKAHLVNPTVCIGHGACLRACPVDAIQLVIGSEKRGVDIPMVLADFQSNVPGLYIVGELGGMGLVYNAMTQALQCMGSIVAQKPKKQDGMLQVLIVGAGPAGLAASLAAKEAGLSYACVDQESIGGTVLHFPRHKIVMTKPVKLPLYGKLHVSEIKKEQLLEVWQDIIAKTGVEVQTGVRVESVKPREGGGFDVKTSAGDMPAQRVVLAMGRRGSPRKLGVPGEDLSKVVYRLIDAEAHRGRNVLVVGGGDAAVEAAVSLGEAGANVHLVHRGKVFDRIKSKNQHKLDDAIAKKQVNVLLDAQTKELRDADVVVKVGADTVTLPNDDALVLIGGILPTAFLEAAGVKVQTFKGEVFAPANQ